MRNVSSLAKLPQEQLPDSYWAAVNLAAHYRERLSECHRRKDLIGALHFRKRMEEAEARAKAVLGTAFAAHRKRRCNKNE